MKSILLIAALLTAMALAGCANTAVGLRAGTPATTGGGAPTPGSSYSSASIHVEANPNAYFGLLFLGYIAAGVHDSYQQWSGGPVWREPPQLLEGRAIVERDCSQPMETPSANLRCK